MPPKHNQKIKNKQRRSGYLADNKGIATYLIVGSPHGICDQLARFMYGKNNISACLGKAQQIQARTVKSKAHKWLVFVTHDSPYRNEDYVQYMNNIILHCRENRISIDLVVDDPDEVVQEGDPVVGRADSVAARWRIALADAIAVMGVGDAVAAADAANDEK